MCLAGDSAPINPAPPDSSNFHYNSSLAGESPDISVKDPTTPETRLKDLQNYTYTKDPANTMLENFSQVTFQQAYDNIIDAAPTPAAGNIPGEWDQVRQGIINATHVFTTGLYALESNPDSPDAWQGATHDAAVQNLTSSLPIPTIVSTAAGVMSWLAEAFLSTMGATYNDIASNYASYQAGLRDFPQHQNEIQNAYNGFAQKVMTTVYSPNILNIAQNNPSFYSGAPPQVGGGTAGLGGLNGLGGMNGLGGGGGAGFTGSAFSTPRGGGGLGSFGGGGGTGGGSVGGTPALPKFPSPTAGTGTPQVPTTPQVPSTPQTPAASQVPTDPASGLSSQMSGLDGLSGLSSPLQSALGQAASAAQQAANAGGRGAVSGAGKLPPEGVLGLGPKGIKGSSGAAGGAGGGPAGPRGSLGKPAGAPATAAGGGTGRTVAAGSRAGISTGAAAGTGAPGAGGPGSGHQGAAAAGTQHQPSKALRRKKNGEEIIGDTDAVVAVLGEPARAETTKPSPTT
jgi:hypothetical protein